MIIEIEINGARVRISGDNLSVAVVDETTGRMTTGFWPDAFPLPGHIVKLADIYCARLGFARSTVSTTIFNDGKRIDRLRSGLGITVQCYNEAMRWFSANWPDGAVWPHDVPRPSAEVAA